MPFVECPKCRAELDIERSDLGHTIECPQCLAVFPAVEELGDWRRDDPRRAEEDDPHEAFRRRNELDPRTRERDRARAEQIVGQPAQAMAVTSIIAVFVSLLMGVGLGIFAVNLLDNGGAKEEEQGIEVLFYAVALGVCSPIYHIVLYIAAQKSKQIEGTGWPYTAAIMGISSIVLCGPCTIFSIFTTIYGVKLIIAMSKPEVMRTLRWNKEGPTRHRGSPLEDDDAAR